ncbi:MAG: hypothetical protein IKB02_06235, partial [Clostridia bacterium]|nr:hypothetical protein [Clostridia bacterium]
MAKEGNAHEGVPLTKRKLTKSFAAFLCGKRHKEKLSKRKCRFHEALLAAARSHFGSDNRTGLSFTTE